MNNRNINVGIIGFGNIGKKRFIALKKIKNYKINLVYISDVKKPKISLKNINYFKKWQKVEDINVDLIIISTPSNESKKITKKFCKKFNLLVEKPLSNKFSEIKKYTSISSVNNRFLKIGYNLRFDDGLRKAKQLITKKLLGKIYYIKITYANGAAKTNTNKVGSLLDMGSHSINLIEWLLSNSNLNVIKEISQKNEFLKKKKTDNGFIILKSKNIPIMIHHGFCTWKNKFYLEISGSKGFIRVQSLSKWFNQKVEYGIRRLPDGKPIIKRWFYKKDNSWKNELNYVFNNILDKKNIKQINEEGYKTMRIINKILNNV